MLLLVVSTDRYHLPPSLSNKYFAPPPLYLLHLTGTGISSCVSTGLG